MDGGVIALTVAVLALILAGILVRQWVSVYNKFQYWINRAKRKFADVDIIMQERLDKIQALSQIVKKYDIHEWKVLKDTIEARSQWTKDTPLNEMVKNTSEIENNYLKIQAVFEKYPQIKADRLHASLMASDAGVERRLRKTRLEYNRVAQQYNERVARFPRNLVAKFHKFYPFEYLVFQVQEREEPQQAFDPKGIFADN
ncbi:MAG: LemA family protein [Dehalogenimonas sp.]|uniref:LemA family protein n=1 Tax=Candidatus Dehalogenimonas loeffleri TaxID=3127115 RepID=A0ABZ2J550_9CHLR|nr:LemA family protein [Dehalogenimonas sp.]